MPTLTEHLTREQARWTCADGSRVVLDSGGRLLARPGPSGPLEVIRERATVADAESYVAGLVGHWQRRGRGDDKPGPAPREAQGRRPRAGKGQGRSVVLTPEQEAEVDARVLAHRERVQAELERLGRSTTEARLPGPQSKGVVTWRP